MTVRRHGPRCPPRSTAPRRRPSAPAARRRRAPSPGTSPPPPASPPAPGATPRPRPRVQPRRPAGSRERSWRATSAATAEPLPGHVPEELEDGRGADEGVPLVVAVEDDRELGDREPAAPRRQDDLGVDEPVVALELEGLIRRAGQPLRLAVDVPDPARAEEQRRRRGCRPSRSRAGTARRSGRSAGPSSRRHPSRASAGTSSARPRRGSGHPRPSRPCSRRAAAARPLRMSHPIAPCFSSITVRTVS